MAIAAGADVIAVLVFVAIGRRNHDESGTITGLLTTLWPFLAGAAVGWAIAFAFTRATGFAPARLLPVGVIVWVSTVVVGMVLRAVSGQGTAIAFCIVASIATGVLLLGWRAVYALIAARANR